MSTILQISAEFAVICRGTADAQAGVRFAPEASAAGGTPGVIGSHIPNRGDE